MRHTCAIVAGFIALGLPTLSQAQQRGGCAKGGMMSGGGMMHCHPGGKMPGMRMSSQLFGSPTMQMSSQMMRQRMLMSQMLMQQQFQQQQLQQQQILLSQQRQMLQQQNIPVNLPGGPNPLQQQFNMPNPRVPVQPGMPNPLDARLAKQDPLAHLDAKNDPNGKADLVAKEPVAREKFTPLVRSEEGKALWSKRAFERGMRAESQGNLLYARACYQNAASTYPETAFAQHARDALDRLKQ